MEPLELSVGVERPVAPGGDGTEVTIVHRGWARHWSAAEVRRGRNRRGWAGVTEHYRAACAAAAHPSG